MIRTNVDFLTAKYKPPTEPAEPKKKRKKE
jgi:hypothetical protein